MTERGDGLQRVDHGFGPLYDDASRILFLGTMASPASRSQGFFYMHPRNRFWPVMEALFADPGDPTDHVGTSVPSRRAFALRHHIALWDAIESCDIRNASDASIRNVVPSDLAPIITGSRVSHIPALRLACFTVFPVLCAWSVRPVTNGCAGCRDRRRTHGCAAGRQRTADHHMRCVGLRPASSTTGVR